MRLLATLLLASLPPAPAFATAGLAEWEIKTPGGNLISHVDPYIASHGTCLRAGANPETVYVARLEWWRTYRGAVAGKARQGFFLFEETRHAVRFFPAAEGLNAAIRQQRLGAPTSPQLTPADGWKQAWGPFFTETCRQFETGGPRFQGLDEASRAGVRQLCGAMKQSR
jgi:hypothetical protein